MLLKLLTLMAMIMPIKAYAQTVVDLHQQRIGCWNIQEKVAPALANCTLENSQFSLDLSDNFITDDDVSTLVAVLSDCKQNLRELNLSNNRLTIEGIKAFVPLLRSEKLQWLNLSINNIGVSDFSTLWKAIDSYAYRMAIVEDLGSYETLRDQMASKVVLLQGDYHTDRFPLAPPFVSAHQGYYDSTH